MVGAISPMGLVLCCCLIGHLAVPMIVVPVVALALPGKGFTLGWTRSPSPTILFALGKAQTKQALLLQKLQVAKQQQQSNEKASATNDNVTKRLPDESPQNPDYRADQNRQENNQQQQLAEFAALLSQHAPPKEPKERPFIQPEVALVQGAVEKLLAPKLSPPPPPKPKGAPPSRRKKQGSNANTENMNDTNLVVALQQGDVSERRHFESLQCVFSNRPIGPIGAAQMVPWVPPFLSQTMIVVADPRPRSSEWRAAVQFLEGAMASAAAFDQSKKLSTTNTAATAVVVVAITVDSPDETLAWLRRIGRAENSSSENNGAIRIFSDVNQQWIKQYGADKGRSSLTLYSMDSDGVIQQLIREMDPSQTVRLVSEITQSAAKV